MGNITLKCKDCKEDFVFTEWEQGFFERKGWVEPVRCVSCRRRKRVLQMSLEDGIPITDQGVHEAICADCGKKFLSNLEIRKNEKEYCTDCWAKLKGYYAETS
jgi:hypothetical protein